MSFAQLYPGFTGFAQPSLNCLWVNLAYPVSQVSKKLCTLSAVVPQHKIKPAYAAKALLTISERVEQAHIKIGIGELFVRVGSKKQASKFVTSADCFSKFFSLLTFFLAFFLFQYFYFQFLLFPSTLGGIRYVTCHLMGSCSF